MDKKTIYAGEDISMRFTAMGDDGTICYDLDLYDVVVVLSNAAMCRRIMATTTGQGDARIEMSNDNSNFTLTIGHGLTAQLCSGDLTLSVMLIHKQSGARTIAEQRAITIAESKIGRIVL